MGLRVDFSTGPAKTARNGGLTCFQTGLNSSPADLMARFGTRPAPTDPLNALMASQGASVVSEKWGVAVIVRPLPNGPKETFQNWPG